MTASHALIEEAFGTVASRMDSTGFAGHLLRERQHLDPFTKDAFEARLGTRPQSRKLTTSHFPGLGAVDVVLARPRALIELKWSYQLPGKIFESVWDATKLLLLAEAHEYETLYIVAGAALDEWHTSECADLFAPGEIDAIEMWSRALAPPRSPNRGATVGEDLVIGGRGNQPRQAHARLSVERVAAFSVDGDFELRAARIAPAGAIVQWPRFEPTSSGDAVSVHRAGGYLLPARVTQRWIETTAPRLGASEIPAFLHALRLRGWTEEDLRQRVRPHLIRE